MKGNTIRTDQWIQRNTLRNLSLTKKITLLVVVMSIFMAGIGMTGYYYLQKSMKRNQTLYTDSLLPIKVFNQIRVQMKSNENQILKLITTDSEWKRKDVLTEVHALDETTEKLFLESENLHLASDQMDQLKVIESMKGLFLKNREAIFAQVDQGKNNEAFQTYLEAVPLLDALHNTVNELAANLESIAENIQQQNESESLFVKNMMLSIVIFGCILSLILGYLMARLLSRPIKKMVGEMEEVAKGNLAIVRPNSVFRDEVGQLENALHLMVRHLRHLILQVNETSEMVNTASQELASGARQTAAAANQIACIIKEVTDGSGLQLRRLEVTTGALEDMSFGIQRIAESSFLLAEKSAGMEQECKAGNMFVMDTVIQMNSISERVQLLETSVKQLNERSESIGGVIGVIRELASQTNLLSLNASIEAARAGEAGRGFAVVAAEVRKLSEQSERSADKITKLVSEIQEQTQESVKATHLVSQAVNTGISIVHDAGKAFSHILNTSKEVADEVQEVSASTEELSSGAQIVTSSVQEVKAMAEVGVESSREISIASQGQLTMMQDISTSAETLRLLVTDLRETINKFVL